jgi:protein O-GlcNAcase/histone acetyltransferase
LELFDWMAAWGLNTYLYAPKDDLKQRAIWRERYSPAEAAKLAELVHASRQRGLRLVYALSPGLDIRYRDPADLARLQARLEQIMSLGCAHFALLFDDIPDKLDPEDLKQWGSLASAQCQVTNTVLQHLRERQPDASLIFCPTPYCGRMAASQLGGADYLPTIGRELAPEIDIFWTGPDIVSREITVAHLEVTGAVLRRKPLIWDNLHANDYDGRRFHCGPVSGRPPGLRAAARGLMSNPNCEFPLNYTPVRTLGEFVRCQGAWDARAAYLSAMLEWLAKFATAGRPVALDDLILLGDCHYLPHEEGPGAETLLARARRLLEADPAEWTEADITAFNRESSRLRVLCGQLTELRNRPLFHALGRRLWDLREELDLLEKYVDSQFRGSTRGAPFRSDFHLPKTFRGGTVARLQALLAPGPDGIFKPLAKTLEGSSPATARWIRPARLGDEAGAYHVCLKTGDFGQDGEPFYRDDPDALGRIFVGPYLAFEPELALILEDSEGICGYALGAMDTRKFYSRYETEWRPRLVARFPLPIGDPGQWTRAQQVHGWYHHPDYFFPEPRDIYPSHLHIDLLERAQGQGHGRRMLEQVMERLRQRGSPGAHLGVSLANPRARGFYERLGFRELVRVGEGRDGCVYMGKSLHD